MENKIKSKIELQVEWCDHDKIILSNSKGDTFTSTAPALNEELGDFLSGCDSVSQQGTGMKWTDFDMKRCYEVGMRRGMRLGDGAVDIAGDAEFYLNSLLKSQSTQTQK